MELNTTQVLTTLDGEPLKEGDKDLTIGRVLSGALISPSSDKKLKPVEAMDRYELAMDLRKKEKINLSATQVEMCREAVCASFAPLVSGQVCILLK